MKIGKAGLDLIKEFEGLKLTPYLDSAGIPTIGIGCTSYKDGTKVMLHDAPLADEAAAYDLLAYHVGIAEADINSHDTSPLTQNEFDALVCFTYNVGVGAVNTSTLLRLINAGKHAEAAEHFVDWDHSRIKGTLVEVAGLKRRRLAEKALFLKKDLDEESEEAPAEPAPSSSNVLGDGPSEDDIKKMLSDVEAKVLK